MIPLRTQGEEPEYQQLSNKISDDYFYKNIKSLMKLKNNDSSNHNGDDSSFQVDEMSPMNSSDNEDDDDGNSLEP